MELVEGLFKDNTLMYKCPVCHKTIKVDTKGREFPYKVAGNLDWRGIIDSCTEYTTPRQFFVVVWRIYGR